MCLTTIYTDINRVNPVLHISGLRVTVIKFIYYELVTADFSTVYKATSTIRKRKKSENAMKTLQTFSVHTVPEKFEKKNSQERKSHDHHDVIVLKVSFENVFRRHQNTKPAFSTSSDLKSLFEKLCFCDGLVWTVGLTVKTKLRFCDGLVWTVGLTVKTKLRFCDGLVWTVSLTVETKLRFYDGLVWTVGLTVETKLRFCDGLMWTVHLTVETKLRSCYGLVWTVGLSVETKFRFCDGLVWTVGLTWKQSCVLVTDKCGQ